MSKSLYTTIVEAVAPTTETVGVVGQLYLDTSVPTLYQCTAVESSVYIWTALGGVSQEDFDNAANYRDFKINYLHHTYTDNDLGGLTSSYFVQSETYNPKQENNFETSKIASKSSLDSLYRAVSNRFVKIKTDIDGLNSQLADLNTALEAILGV